MRQTALNSTAQGRGASPRTLGVSNPTSDQNPNGVPLPRPLGGLQQRDVEHYRDLVRQMESVDGRSYQTRAPLTSGFCRR